MKRRYGEILSAISALWLATALYPPWILRIVDNNGYCSTVSKIGYAPLLGPPDPLYKGGLYCIHVDYIMLAMEWIISAFVVMAMAKMLMHNGELNNPDDPVKPIFVLPLLKTQKHFATLALAIFATTLALLSTDARSLFAEITYKPPIEIKGTVIYPLRTIKAGEVITAELVTPLQIEKKRIPGTAVRRIEDIIGHKAIVDLPNESMIDSNSISK